MYLIILFNLCIGVLSFNNIFFKNSLKITNKDSKKQNIGVIFFPGYGKNAESYKNLSYKLCGKLENKNIGSTILICNYLNDLPIAGHLQTKILTDSAIKEIKNDRSVDRIFFIGHSAGSYFLNNIAKEKGDGFIQLGSVLNSNGILPWEKESLYNYPIPVLTLLGEKDGYMNPFLAKDELENIKFLENPYLKPVIIEKQVNHLQISDNKETKYAKIFNKEDIKSKISIEEAQENLTDTISEFIVTCLNKDYDSILLSEKMNLTREAIKIFDHEKCDLTSLSTSIQYDIINPLFYQDIPINNTVYSDKTKFLRSKPKINNGTIETCTFVDDKSIYNKYYSNSIWLKMKNQDAFVKSPNYNHINVKKTKSAYEFNENIFNGLLLKYKSDFEIFNGPKVVFSQDIIYDNGPLIGVNWAITPINIEYNKLHNILTIRSPVLYTGLDVPNPYKGMYYMKILSPRLCYELITLYF